MAACSRGNEYEPTFIASIWKQPPTKHAHDIIAIATPTDAASGVKPKGSEQATNSRNMPTGRRLSAANRSAAHPPTKYPTPQASGGIQKMVARSACATPSPRVR
jgi:hypothetical protein